MYNLNEIIQIWLETYGIHEFWARDLNFEILHV